MKGALLAILVLVEDVLFRRTARAVWRLICEAQPDILALNNGLPRRLMRLVERFGPSRTVVHARGWPSAEVPNINPRPYLIAMSASILERYIAAGWSSARASFVYDAFPIPRPPVPPPDVLTETRRRPCVALVASLEPWKGHSVFLDAASILVKRRRDVHFLIVGGETLAHPGYRSTLAARIEELRLGDHIEITGWRTDVLAVMAAVHVVVHASVEPEPFGNVVAEAMSLAKPVVASDAGGPREMIRDGLDGLLAEPGSPTALAACIDRFLDDPHLGRRLGASARQRVVTLFSQRKFVEDMQRIYEHVLQREVPKNGS
jgi:glycosyltransferase involved in cell wall biosynthesis